MQYVRIRNLREDMDMTQTDMAKVLFISQRTYSYYESAFAHDHQALLFLIAGGFLRCFRGLFVGADREKGSEPIKNASGKRLTGCGIMVSI